MAKIRPTNDGRWIADARVRGKGPQKVFSTRKAAQAYLDDIAVARRAGAGFIDPARSRPFSVAADMFLVEQESRVNAGEIGGGQLVNQRTNARHLCAIALESGASLGATRLAEITPAMVKGPIRRSIADGRAPKTARNIYVTFRQVLDFAVGASLVATSPAVSVKPAFGRSDKEDRAQRITKDAIAAIAAAAGSERASLLIRFAAYTGLRSGEQAALIWDDIDLENGLVHVRRARKWSGEVEAPKTHNGTRSIPLAPELLASLRAWKMGQPAKQRRLDLVFPSNSGAMEVSADNWRKRILHPACAAAGAERVTWHDLRHFFASVLIYDLGELPDATVAELMGHDSIDFTRRQYGHWLADRDRDRSIADKLGAAFKGASLA
jgi:integrase